jgi:hypothetical protein
MPSRYVTPVQVTLSTESGATTRYKIGNGTFQTYDGPFTLDADGTHEVTYRSTDAAGNVEADKTVVPRIDRTGPSVACSAIPGVLWPPDGRFVPVAVGLDLDDATSGTGSFRLESVTSSEGGTGFARNWRVGFADTVGELLAMRNENPTRGRTYNLTYTVFDRAGNSRPCVATVSVPKSKPAGASAALQAVLPSAEGGGVASTAAPTTNWFTFGRTRLVGARLRVTLRLPADGAVRVGGRVRITGRKAIRIRTRRVSGRAGSNRLTVRIPRAARQAVAGGARRAKLTLRVSYRPEGTREWRRRTLTIALIDSRSG